MALKKPEEAIATGGLARPPARRSDIAGFMVMDVMRAAAAFEASGRAICHMEVGQPATPAPRAALDAVRRTLDRDTLGYTLALGLDPLRDRIARHYRERYGVEVATERVVVTTGSSAAFLLAFLALFDVGQRVALPSPGYPCYRHILAALGIGSVPVETGPQSCWMPTVEALSAIPGSLDGLLVASPANPTGTLLEPERLAALTAFCRSRAMWFISDEIYHGLTYGAVAETALASSDQAIVINSFSKYFSMTGWRVGWMVVPPGLVRTIERLAQNFFIAPPAVSQVAALGAFDGIEELERNRRTYAANRDILLAALPAMGLDRLAPADGAFYVYADVAHLTEDSRQLAGRLLEEAGIAATPGLDFDEARGHRYLRFSYAGATADIERAVRAMTGFRWAAGPGR
ncbi:MAG: pyridoxal phosphate-dependent aminotransferase [Hyphomicrobium sp.]